MDLFIYNLGLIGVGIGITYIQRDGLALYPDANSVAAIALAAILMAVVCVGMWLWVNVLPRSGAPFVFLAQPRFRAAAYALSFVECAGWLYYLSITATLVLEQAAIPLAAILGGPTCWAVHLLSSPSMKFCVGTATLGLATMLLLCGMPAFWRCQKIVFVLAMLGTIALLIALGQDRTQFHQNFNALYPQFGSDPYRAVIDQAHAWKFAATVPHPFKRTIAFMVWPFLSLLGSAFSMGIAGESRDGARGHLPAMLGSLAIGALSFIAVAILARHSIGNGFQGAIAYNYDTHPAGALSTFSTPFDPNLCYLACVATNSTVLRLFIVLGFACWIWFWIPGVLLYTSRSVRSWTKLSETRPGLSKAGAVLIVAAVAEICLFAGIYKHFNNGLVLILPLITCWLGTLIVGALLPGIWPKLYKSSPIANWKITGIPVMTIACLLGAAVLSCVLYLLWRDSDAAGHSRKSLETITGLFVVGLGLYGWMRSRRSVASVES